MKRICTICARGGSKGVKSKNVRQLLGKPLIAYSLDQAAESGLFDMIAVSSDSPEILEVAKAFGANLLVRRPADLATDHAAKLPVIRHCVEAAARTSGRRWDVVVDLDATSPLRVVHDIQAAVMMLEDCNIANVITGTPARRSPYFNLVEIAETGVVHLSKTPPKALVRRQDCPQCFDMNASIYVWKFAALFEYPTIFTPETRLYVMPEERSVDIDSELDFDIVEILLRRRSL